MLLVNSSRHSDNTMTKHKKTFSPFFWQLAIILNFVPMAKQTDEFLVKHDVEKFLRCIQLKAFVHDQGDASNEPEKYVL